MDADRAGAWAAFAMAALFLGVSAWAVFELEHEVPESTATSGEEVPRFAEHFTDADGPAVPRDDTIRMAWHPAESDLGIPAETYRAEDLGVEGQGTVLHEAVPARATLDLRLRWLDASRLHLEADIDLETDLGEEGILRMIVVEDGVETPTGQVRDAVIRLYQITIAFNQSAGGSSTVNRTFEAAEHGLPMEDRSERRLTFILLLSNYDSEENLALLATPVPVRSIGPVDDGARASALIGFGLLLLCLAAVVRAEWKREVMLPRLTGGRSPEGAPLAVLRAGGRETTLREVRVLPPWRLSKRIAECTLQPGQEKTFQLQIKPERGAEPPTTSCVETEWSVKVDEMGGWVLDLTLHRGPAK